MDNNDKSQFFSTREAIKKWLDSHKIKNYTINDDLSVDVNDDVSIFGRDLKAIPIKFGNVTGKFWCSNNKLTSLTGSPKTVGGDFLCHRNQLTNLLGSPETVGGLFSCWNNKLMSLTELINCNFKEKIYFNIEKDNLKQKELISIPLKEYYNSIRKRYELTNRQFQDIMKPVLEKEALQEKLINSRIKNKTKSSFI